MNRIFELNNDDCKVIYYALKCRLDEVTEIVEVIARVKKTGRLSFIFKDKEFLPDNLKELSIEELVEQLDAFISLELTLKDLLNTFKEESPCGPQ